jgi:hypothetical protein
MLMGELTAVYEMKKRLNEFYPKERWIRYQIAPAFPFARSAMMRKIARYAYQAIFVDGIGRNSNRLPHDLRVEITNGGNESRQNYLSK